MRFQKRIKILPGVRVNLSGSGASLSLGVPGANMNIGKKGVTRTLGLPGTGLSWSKSAGWEQSRSLSSGDEIQIIADSVNAVGKPLSKIPAQVNASVTRAEKAVASYSGGRGASESKLTTLTNRINAELEKVEQSYETLEEAAAFLEAVETRLSAMTFGLFSGAKRKRRDNVLEGVQQGRSSVERAVNEVASEIEKLHSNIDSAVNALNPDIAAVGPTTDQL